MGETDDARVACTLSSTLLKRIRSTLGNEGVHDVVRRSGVSHGVDYLEEVSNWIPYAEVVSLFEAAVELTTDEQLGWRVGQDAVRQHAGTVLAGPGGRSGRAAADRGCCALRREARGQEPHQHRRLGVVPKHVCHPDPLGGWSCQATSPKEDPDEAPR